MVRGGSEEMVDWGRSGRNRGRLLLPAASPARVGVPLGALRRDPSATRSGLVRRFGGVDSAHLFRACNPLAVDHKAGVPTSEALAALYRYGDRIYGDCAFRTGRRAG